MADIVVRLPPTFATLRDLFVRTGNRCAFPGCDRVLVNAKGQWVGEVCHIQGAMPGGERFNEDMTNEERRHRENLVLMCHEHHVETNDVGEFPVARLVEMKADHEAQYAGPPPVSDTVLEIAVQNVIAPSIDDLTDQTVLLLPQTLTSFGDVMALGESAEELQSALTSISPSLQALRRLSVDTRAVFAILVDRTVPGESVAVPVHELEGVTGSALGGLAPHFETLSRYGLARLEEIWDEVHPPHFDLVASSIDGWEFWDAFRQFCADCNLRPKEIINELRFDALD